MKKEDYHHLTSKYSFLSDYEERYRKGLLDFINEAFEKHGGEFEYKCPTHDSWKEADENDEFFAMDDLPVFLNISVVDDNNHEVYPYRITQTNGAMYKAIEVCGYDWYDSDWVEHMEASYDIDSLQSIAAFINAVLLQEQESQEDE